MTPRDNKILILGGYGNFGKRIAVALVAKGIPVVIAGRNAEKATNLADKLGPLADTACFDAYTQLSEQLPIIRPTVVINTCGPFQASDYSVAETCIAQGVHYIDLADGRDFVTGITQLDASAKQAGVRVISGASTVPCLSSAVLEHYAEAFSAVESLKFGISPGQKTERGLATTQAIMSYVGKPLAPFPSIRKRVYGWQDIYRQHYPEIGKRWMANCDIPDLDLLPQRYDLKHIQFSAGVELSFLHLGLWVLSWLVRLGIPLNLPKLANPLLRISNWFNRIGSADGGMHMILQGKDTEGKPHTRSWFLVAKDGHGPHIPTIPAILLAEQLANKQITEAGAMPCMGLVTLNDYLKELESYDIKTYETAS